MAESKVSYQRVIIDPRRMVALLSAIETTHVQESIGMLCLALSFVYRAEMADRGMTIIEFTDLMAKQIRHLIANPPDADPVPTPGCDCAVCAAKRKVMQ